ncbi:ABC transporter substrate-binding protein [Pseudopedobacter saltans DSM 12145]|uniref:ABC transporter substrate-binding protein n=1 Tax=Pseudopedobacter saltans (strain ATCC 51119 / DSM 12145 / JCM 21818 / CCUG 39354 / LMG 10337 / NBRC 100064 / NCIMB 13643) TaxID=762903 RepID=F0S8E3_PSESL|nr:ABC transporter substrate-binding protein [Pseudopedobacter saltans DSM 12145]
MRVMPKEIASFLAMTKIVASLRGTKQSKHEIMSKSLKNNEILIEGY